MSRQPCAYILARGRNGTLYIGVTSNLIARLHQHRSAAGKGFSARYEVNRLVYFEMLEDMYSAISREKQLKAWRREWKVNLIERENANWDDLAPGLGLPPADGPPSSP
jgi:putative endonuclease